MAKGILKDQIGIHMGLNGSLCFYTKRRITSNKDKSRVGIREPAQAKWFLCGLLRHWKMNEIT